MLSPVCESDFFMELTLATRILTLFLIGGVGYWLQHRGAMGKDGRDAIVRVVMLVFFPCMSFHSMATKIDPDAVMVNVTVAGLSFAMIVFGALLGYAAVRPTGLTGGSRSTFIHMCACNNYVFMPLPIVHFLWPAQDGIIFLVMLGAGIAYWTAGVYPLVQGHHPLHQLKNLMNLPFLSTVAGLVVAMMGWTRYFQDGNSVLNAFFQAAELLGTPTAPCAILLVGAGLANATASVSARTMVWYSAVRLVIFPVLFLPFLAFSGLSMLDIQVLLLVAMTPASNTSTLIAQRFGGDPQLASSANLYSTLLSGVTIPLLHPQLLRLTEWMGALLT